MRSFNSTTPSYTSVSERVPGEPHPDCHTNVNHFYTSMERLVGWDDTKIRPYQLEPTDEEKARGEKGKIENWLTMWNESNIATHAEFCFLTPQGKVFTTVQFHVNTSDFQKRITGLENYLINKRIVLGFNPNLKVKGKSYDRI